MANDKNQLNGWISDYFQVNQSPFYKKEHHGKYIHGKPKKQKDMRIPISIYNDLDYYFKENGLNWTDGMLNVIYDKLDMINTSKRTIFNDVELIVIIPKTRSLSELNDKSIILAAYNTGTDFKNEFIHDGGFKKTFNFNYELKDFSFLPIDILMNLKNDAYFNLAASNPYVKGNWREYLQRLENHYKLDLNKSYLVRFPLNNYLDVKREGQYQSSRLRGWHDGLYVFDDFNHHRLYFKLDWEYTPSGAIRCRGEFLHVTDFMYLVQSADYGKVNNAHESLLNNDHDREFMESALKDAEKMRDWIDDQIAFYKKNLGR